MLSVKKIVVAALFFCLSGMVAAYAAPDRKNLNGHVPSSVRRLTANGRLPGTNELRLAIGLPLRDAAGLDEFLRQLADPASPNYKKYLTPEQFAARFGPTESDYAAVEQFARTNGLRITATHVNRLLLDVAGPVAAVEKTFHITLQTYRHPREARDFFAPNTEPTVATSLPVVDIQGLSDYSLPHPNLVRKNLPSATPKFGSAADGYSYFGDDFRAAYVPGTTLNGAGQTVGLLQFDGYYPSDITAYATAAGGGRTNIVIQKVLLDGYGGGITSANGNAEVSLDIEMSMAMAPALAKIIVFEGNPSSLIPNDVLNAMAASNTVKNLSSSWGWSGGPSTTTDNIFKTMAAQGQSFFNASGDSDAFPAGYVDSSANPTTPSSSAYVTEVGGTQLTTPGGGGAYSSETVWNRNNGIGSSGGVSTYYAIPAWQQGINSFLSNGGSMTARNIPDVALTAEYCYVKYGNGSSASFGGTSCAAPLWAGFMALVNQQAVTNGQSSAGFINPAIYELANESIYNSVFHDTTSGNNTWSNSPNAFNAVPNYDLCTGLGSPNGTNLINALLNPDSLIIVSNGGFNSVSSPAGVFSLTSQTFYLTNAGAVPLTWSLNNTATWMNVSSVGGTLAAGAGGLVVVSLNSVASNLTAATYPAGLWFSNVTSGVAHLRFSSLVVNDSLVLATNRFFVGAQSGGPLIQPSQTVILTNARNAAMNWSINNTSTWFTVSPASGTFSSSGQASVSLSLTSTATNLPVGNYTAVFQVTNLTSQIVQGVTATVVISPSLVLNGGFETGDFTAWTLNDNGSGQNFIDNGTYIASHSGSYCAALGQNGSNANLTQTLLTQPGQMYLLSFWLDNPTAGYSFPSGGTERFKANWNTNATSTNTLYSISNPAAFGWTSQSFVVTATGTNTILQFSVRNDPNIFGLDDITVTPGYPPAISVPPTNLTLLAGSTANFSALATGSTNLVYQWRKNGTNISNGTGIAGATTTNLTLTAITTNSSGNYNLFVTNIFGVTTSSVASLTVVLPPTITSSALTNRTIQCGSSTNIFSITAAGTAPLFMQWQTNGTPVTSATNSTFALTNLHFATITNVAVIITNAYASLTSNAVLTVQDTLVPVITLNGSNPFFIELGSVYTDPGATAADACAGSLSVATSGTVNTNVLGTNTIFYTASDGFNSVTNTRTVIVRDTTPPTILSSATNLVLAANANCYLPLPDMTGTNFILATDLSGALTITQSPTNGTILFPGTNIVVLTVKDASSNAAFATNRIIIQDQTPPVITLTGGNPVFSELGQPFTDPGATAVDSCVGAVAVTVSGFVNTNAVGTNTLTYTANDGRGNTNFALRSIIIRDTTPPTILWSFTNLIVAANSNCVTLLTNVTGTNFILATDLSGALTISQSPTNNFILPLGTNTIVITVADASGNKSYSTNTVVVLDQTPPQILAQPQSLTNFIGTTATFNFAATACTPLTFQWYSNNSLTIFTNSTLTLSNLAESAAGNYFAVANANGGATTSAVVTLTVNLYPPAISTGVFSFNGGLNLNLSGSPGHSYILEATTNLLPTGNWLPLATNTLGTNGVWSFTDSTATNIPFQFYRLKLAP